MKCSKCEKGYDDSFAFCPHCSEPKQSPSSQLATAETPPNQPQYPVASKPRFNWKIAVVIGVVGLLVVTGVALGLIFGLRSGENNVEGTYVMGEGYLSLTLTLIPDGVSKLTEGLSDTGTTGKYVVKGDMVKAWTGGDEEDTKGLTFTIDEDNNLVDDDGDVWVKQGE